MEKSIIIMVDSDGYHFSAIGLNESECIGLLEMYKHRLLSKTTEAVQEV